MPSGRDIAKEILTRSGTERDEIVLAHILAGHLPSWLRSKGWRRVRRSMVLGGKLRTLDGIAVDIDRNVAQDPVLYPLVIDDEVKNEKGEWVSSGPYPLRFPNVTKGGTPIVLKAPPSGVKPVSFLLLETPSTTPKRSLDEEATSSSGAVKVVAGLLGAVLFATGVVIVARS